MSTCMRLGFLFPRHVFSPHVRTFVVETLLKTRDGVSCTPVRVVVSRARAEAASWVLIGACLTLCAAGYWRRKDLLHPFDAESSVTTRVAPAWRSKSGGGSHAKDAAVGSATQTKSRLARAMMGCALFCFTKSHILFVSDAVLRCVSSCMSTRGLSWCASESSSVLTWLPAWHCPASKKATGRCDCGCGCGCGCDCGCERPLLGLKWQWSHEQREAKASIPCFASSSTT